MAVKIHDIEGVEASVALDVAWSDEIGLMDIVEPQGIGEIGVCYPLGSIRSFF